MQTAEFLARIIVQGVADDVAEADRDAEVVLTTLADTLTPQESRHLARQLPGPYEQILVQRADNGAPPQSMDRPAFISQVQTDLGLSNSGEADRVVHGVVAAVRAAVSGREFQQLVDQLPGDLKMMVATA